MQDSFHLLKVLAVLFLACNPARAFSPSAPRARTPLGLHQPLDFGSRALDASLSTPLTASKADPAELAKLLGRDGFVVVPTKLKLDIPELRLACQDHLKKLLEAVEATGCDPFEQEYLFSEICHRARYRWDMPMTDELIWKDFCLAAFQAAKPVLNEMTGGKPMCIERSGVVISRPGAPAQGFHNDGENDLYNIFIPLVDIPPDSDGTQFWAGSHMIKMNKAMSMFASGSVDFATEMAAPSVEAGGLLLFHYRTIHRGLASLGRERAVAYLCISTQTKASDTHNFPKRSVFNSTGLDCSRIPYWNDGRYRAIDWDDMTAKQQFMAVSTAQRLLINALRLSFNKSSTLGFNDHHHEEIEHATKEAERIIIQCCEENGLDWKQPRSRYEVAAAVQNQFFSYADSDSPES